MPWPSGTSYEASIAASAAACAIGAPDAIGSIHRIASSSTALARDVDDRTSTPAELGEQTQAELEALGITVRIACSEPCSPITWPSSSSTRLERALPR